MVKGRGCAAVCCVRLQAHCECALLLLCRLEQYNEAFLAEEARTIAWPCSAYTKPVGLVCLSSTGSTLPCLPFGLISAGQLGFI